MRWTVYRPSKQGNNGRVVKSFEFCFSGRWWSWVPSPVHYVVITESIKDSPTQRNTLFRPYGAGALLYVCLWIGGLFYVAFHSQFNYLELQFFHFNIVEIVLVVRILQISTSNADDSQLSFYRTTFIYHAMGAQSLSLTIAQIKQATKNNSTNVVVSIRNKIKFHRSLIGPELGLDFRPKIITKFSSSTKLMETVANWVLIVQSFWITR